MSTINILNRMQLRHGGSENRSIELNRLINEAGYNSSIWSEYPAEDKDFFKNHNVKLVKPYSLTYPKSGIFILVSYYWVGKWLKYSRPQRIVIVHNVPSVQPLTKLLERLVDLRVSCPISVVYAGKWMKETTGIDGPVLLSPIDLNRFKPHRSSSERSSTFTVGRLSRDGTDKHHPDDPDLYNELASLGIRVRLMGAECLRSRIKNSELIELIPNNAEPSDAFLNTLSCFFYRTSPSYIEPHGRVVHEALASGLPIVCGNRGGFTEDVLHGENGYIVNSNADALKFITGLRSDNTNYARLSLNARKKAEAIHSSSEIDKMIRYLVNQCRDNYNFTAQQCLNILNTHTNK